jgi:hypothetical protein
MFRQFLAAGLPVLGITTFSALSLEAKAASFIVSPVSATASSTTPGGYGIGNTIKETLIKPSLSGDICLVLGNETTICRF